MMPEFRDFDAAASEIEKREAIFRMGGEEFKVRLDLPAGKILRWMERGAEGIEQLPTLIRMFLSDEDYERLLDLDVSWAQMQELVDWFIKELAGNAASR